MTYKQTIREEAYEELGLRLGSVKEGKKLKRNEEWKHRFFIRWYTCIVDKPAEEFTIQKEEVAEVEWFSGAEIRASAKADPQEFLYGVIEELALFG